VAEIAASGAERIVCLALYPHFSFATTGSSYNEAARALQRHGLDTLPIHFIPAWHDHPRYLEAMADRVTEAVATVPAGARTHLLFTAHGLPTSFIERGDPYQAQVQQTVRDVVKAVGWEGAHSLAYQSRVGPARWLGPGTDHELERLGASGVEAVVVVPVSFVGDHIETLFELDLEYRHVAEAAGIRHWARAGALDAHPAFVACLADTVRQAKGKPRARECVRCLLPKDDAYHAQSRCLDCKFQKPAYLGLQAQCPPATPGARGC
jgi:ferrochelatase